jgi:hypothetical protein
VEKKRERRKRIKKGILHIKEIGRELSITAK